MNTVKEAYRALRAAWPLAKAVQAIKECRVALSADYARKKTDARHHVIMFGFTPAGAPFANAEWSSGSSVLRWIEKPERQGMRDCGDAGDIVHLEHTGWYTDSDESDTAVGCVYRWGRYYVPAIRLTGVDDNGIAVCWSDRMLCSDASADQDAINDVLRDCARIADQIAERSAEDAREYDNAWSVGQRWRELGDDIQTECEALRDARKACAGLVGVARNIVGAAVRGHLHDIRSMRGDRAKLAAGEPLNRRGAGWYTGDDRLVSAFCEGAELTPDEYKALS